MVTFNQFAAHVAHADRTALLPRDPAPLRIEWIPNTSLGSVYRKGLRIGTASRNARNEIGVRLEYRGETLEGVYAWGDAFRVVQEWCDAMAAPIAEAAE